jgi:hydroxymethylbilane synthase
MKDVPADMPAGFCIAAILSRADPGDALVTRDGETFSDLALGAMIGSSSLRRQAQLKIMRPDVDVRPLRGNVNTRLAKLDQGDYDAIVLASAGLERLGFADRISERFSPEQMLPATGQGAIGIESRVASDECNRILRQLEDRTTRQTTRAERAVCGELQASCQSPVASFATVTEGRLRLRALVASPDGQRVLREELSGHPEDAESIGIELAQALLGRGAAALLQEFSA